MVGRNAFLKYDVLGNLVESLKLIRIVHVIGTLAHAGLEQGVLKIAAGLDPTRFEQTICTIWSLDYMPARPDIRLIPLNRSAKKPGFITRDLLSLFVRERPHIVHSRNWTSIEAVLAARLARIPVIVHSEHGRDILPLTSEPLRRRLFRRACYRMADRVFAVSQELKREFISALGVPQDSFRVIYNGVDTRLFSPSTEKRHVQRRNLGISENTVVVGCVARLDLVKDHITLLRAAEIAVNQGSDLLVVLVGDGPQRGPLEQELRAMPALRNRVIFAGRTFDVAQWLHGFDVFALPSLFEGTSNTLLEAMATGLPVVATRVGGNVELFEENKSGLLFEVGDFQGLASQLTRLAASLELRQHLGAAARKHVEEHFPLERMINDYGEMYEELITVKQSPKL
jgi:sugar transferase (PEP-CTERM/EpsH1 system associated)